MRMTMIVMHNIEQIMMTVKLLLQNQSAAHDFQYVFRVYKNAELISKEEIVVDVEIVLAAALLDDLIVYPKGSIKSTNSADDSAEIAKKILLEHKSELDNFLDIKTQCADNYNQLDCIDVN